MDTVSTADNCIHWNCSLVWHTARCGHSFNWGQLIVYTVKPGNKQLANFGDRKIWVYERRFLKFSLVKVLKPTFSSNLLFLLKNIITLSSVHEWPTSKLIFKWTVFFSCGPRTIWIAALNIVHQLCKVYKSYSHEIYTKYIYIVFLYFFHSMKEGKISYNVGFITF